jgi:DNA-binding response OmpR family regulator
MAAADAPTCGGRRYCGGVAGWRLEPARTGRKSLAIVNIRANTPAAFKSLARNVAAARQTAYLVFVTHVLVVEDDPGIATQLVRGLDRAGYTAESVAYGAEALQRPVPDVVLLDLGLPDIDGVDVCRRLRQQSQAAIIVVTARGEEADRVLALDEGADDYLVKPFGLAELLARIRAVLRRGQRAGTGEVLRHGPLTLDLRTRKVTVSGNDVALTPKEFAILECLATDPGRLVSRQEIIERAWDEHWYGPTKVLDVHLAALRRKLGDHTLIETVYGHGFRLADQ